MSMKYKLFLLVIAFILILQGCAANDVPPIKESMTEEQPTVSESAEKTQEITADNDSEKSEESTAEVQKKELVLPVVINNTGKTLIQTVSNNRQYLYNSYIISSANGENVIVDPTQMPSVDVVDLQPAAIVSTHSHDDHVDPKFTEKYDCPKLLYEKGEVKTNDFTIESILSSHSDDTITEESDNKIIIFEVDGLRIAHMGDIGQTFLTDDQLEKLGQIDIAFMQFENSYSSMTRSNEKGFNIIEQLNPVIIIPTHYLELSILEKRYGAITKCENILEISKEDLPEGHLNVYQILNKHIYS